MLTKNDAERIAIAISALRPQWSQAQIMGVLNDPRIREQRTFADTSRAMTWIATDPESRQPTRIFEHGPWWEMLAPKPTEHNTSAHIRGVQPTDCDICSQPSHRCELDDSHEYRQRNRPTERASTETINRLRGYMVASNWKSKTTEDER